MQNLELPFKSNESIALVCHDAGAANLLLSWLRDFEGSIRPCMKGPAKDIWFNYNGSIPTMSLDEAIHGASVLLTGSGWSSNLEHEARIKAANIGLFSVSVVDHWTNYQERFIRDGDQVLPDEIWISDTYAQAKILKCFPRITTKIFPNYYLLNEVKKVKNLKPKRPKNPPKNILYLLEPIRVSWNGTSELGEFYALKYFLNNLNRIGVDQNVKISLRPHPSDSKGKYDNFILKNSKFNLEINDKESLSKQIAISDWVVGVETFALDIALKAGRIVVSSMPPNGHKFRLPHKNILHLKNMITRST